MENRGRESPLPTATSWRSLVVRDEGYIGQAESCCVYLKPQKIMQPMHGIILQMFDCWADPVVHLLLLKSSMAPLIRKGPN